MRVAQARPSAGQPVLQRRQCCPPPALLPPPVQTCVGPSRRSLGSAVAPLRAAQKLRTSVVSAAGSPAGPQGPGEGGGERSGRRPGSTGRRRAQRSPSPRPRSTSGAAPVPDAEDSKRLALKAAAVQQDLEALISVSRGTLQPPRRWQLRRERQEHQRQQRSHQEEDQESVQELRRWEAWGRGQGTPQPQPQAQPPQRGNGRQWQRAAEQGRAGQPQPDSPRQQQPPQRGRQGQQRTQQQQQQQQQQPARADGTPSTMQKPAGRQAGRAAGPLASISVDQDDMDAAIAHTFPVTGRAAPSLKPIGGGPGPPRTTLLTTLSPSDFSEGGVFDIGAAVVPEEGESRRGGRWPPRMPANVNNVLVVSAALMNSQNQVLLSKRVRGNSKFRGLYEFPGGKVEPGEIPQYALQRELHEELGVEVEERDLQALTFVSHRYWYWAHNFLALLFVAEQWRFEPRSMEGQELVWVHCDELMSYADKVPEPTKRMLAAVYGVMLHRQRRQEVDAAPPAGFMTPPGAAPPAAAQAESWASTARGGGTHTGMGTAARRRLRRLRILEVQTATLAQPEQAGNVAAALEPKPVAPVAVVLVGSSASVGGRSGPGTEARAERRRLRQLERRRLRRLQKNEERVAAAAAEAVAAAAEAKAEAAVAGVLPPSPELEAGQVDDGSASGAGISSAAEAEDRAEKKRLRQLERRRLRRQRRKDERAADADTDADAGAGSEAAVQLSSAPPAVQVEGADSRGAGSSEAAEVEEGAEKKKRRRGRRGRRTPSPSAEGTGEEGEVAAPAAALEAAAAAALPASSGSEAASQSEEGADVEKKKRRRRPRRKRSSRALDAEAAAGPAAADEAPAEAEAAGGQPTGSSSGSEAPSHGDDGEVAEKKKRRRRPRRSQQAGSPDMSATAVGGADASFVAPQPERLLQAAPAVWSSSGSGSQLGVAAAASARLRGQLTGLRSLSSQQPQPQRQTDGLGMQRRQSNWQPAMEQRLRGGGLGAGSEVGEWWQGGGKKVADWWG